MTNKPTRHMGPLELDAAEQRALSGVASDEDWLAMSRDDVLALVLEVRRLRGREKRLAEDVHRLTVQLQSAREALGPL